MYRTPLDGKSNLKYIYSRTHKNAVPLVVDNTWAQFEANNDSSGSFRRQLAQQLAVALPQLANEQLSPLSVVALISVFFICLIGAVSMTVQSYRHAIRNNSSSNNNNNNNSTGEQPVELIHECIPSLAATNREHNNNNNNNIKTATTNCAAPEYITEPRCPCELGPSPLDLIFEDSHHHLSSCQSLFDYNQHCHVDNCNAGYNITGYLEIATSPQNCISLDLYPSNKEEEEANKTSCCQTIPYQNACSTATSTATMTETYMDDQPTIPRPKVNMLENPLIAMLG